VRCLISSHVPSLTQLQQWHFVASGSLQVASALKAVVRSSHSSWGVAAWGIPVVASDTPSAAASLHKWLQQLLGGPSCDITATGIQYPRINQSPLHLQKSNLVASGVFFPLFCVAKSTVPGLIVCVVIKEQIALTCQQY
jgi:hypothetical protein